jgi:nucleoside-diphosphate-sugar epimerase
MSGARILLTGSTGFIGRSLYLHLSPRHRIFCVNRLRQYQPSPSISFADLFTDAGQQELRSFAPTHLIHCAALAHRRPPVSPEGKVRLDTVNVELPVRLAHLAIKLGICRHLFLSTIGVHGSSTNGFEVINESSPLIPANPYAISKIMAECRLREIHGGTPTELTILRPALVYGRGNPGNMRLLVRAIDRGFPFPLASIANRRSFVALENLVSAIEASLFHSDAGGRSFVVADQETISTPILLSTIAKAREQRLCMFSVPEMTFTFLRRLPVLGGKLGQLIDNLVVDSSCIRKDLGWEQPLSQSEAMLLAFR